MNKIGCRSLSAWVVLSVGFALNAQAAATDIPAGTAEFTKMIGESCLLSNLGGSFCSVQGDCGKLGHIDSGASAVGKAVGTGPLVNATGFNTFGRYFGIVNGNKKMWLQVGPVGANNCKVVDGAYADGPINVGAK